MHRSQQVDLRALCAQLPDASSVAPRAPQHGLALAPRAPRRACPPTAAPLLAPAHTPAVTHARACCTRHLPQCCSAVLQCRTRSGETDAFFTFLFLFLDRRLHLAPRLTQQRNGARGAPAPPLARAAAALARRGLRGLRRMCPRGGGVRASEAQASRSRATHAHTGERAVGCCQVNASNEADCTTQANKRAEEHRKQKKQKPYRPAFPLPPRRAQPGAQAGTPF